MAKLLSVNHTPVSWQHVRIIETDENEFSLRSFYTYMEFGPMALIAMGLDRNTKTEVIDLSTALALGVKIEKALVQIIGERQSRKQRVRD